MKNSFEKEKITEGHPKWLKAIERLEDLPSRSRDIRTDFSRDNNRILHCTAYRRLKHKTQVFFATVNDHICTRIEHVNHVASVSHTIATYLGLNAELTSAIAIGHDLGHAPFGHAGETYIKNLLKEKFGEVFWHEKNSLRFVDSIETLEDYNSNHINLNLTYAVRDGIVCHCGEVDEESIFPRSEAIDLSDITKASGVQPFTWEGCIVKISDKISYLGRDIEDAITLKILSYSEKRELLKIIKAYGRDKIRDINNTILIHDFIVDLCENSSPSKGIRLSDKNLEIMKLIKDFNYKHIYNHPRIETFKRYAELIILSIFKSLEKYYDGNLEDTISNLESNITQYPVLVGNFIDWLRKYADYEYRKKQNINYKNKIIYDLNDKDSYILSIVDYISGMTDNFAIKSFKELTTFG